MPSVDPIRFEILRHKILALVDEQAISLRSASGSPVVTESNDFNVGLYLVDGTAVAVGRYILTQAFTTGSIVKSIVSGYQENPGWGSGDMFICNDPFHGSLHGQDISLVAPVYVDGRQIAWVGCCAHQVDVGGMTFGSWCPEAKERQQESMVLTPLRLVEGGRVRKDIWDMILAGSRLPSLLALDLKAMISSNRLAGERYRSLARRYGVETVSETMDELIALADSRLRRRLADLPDGIAKSIDYIDHDGHEDRLYQIRLRMEKKRDELWLDFTGTSLQSHGFINCTHSGLVAGIAAGISPLLAYDLPFNEGLLRPLHIVVPEGCLVNARPPAPTGMASVSAVYSVTSVVVSALGQLLGASERYRCESCARTRGAISIINLTGLTEDGEQFGTMLLDGLAGGGGAWPDRDGLNAFGTFSMPEPNIANVESTEHVAPVLFLYRKFLTDSGGAGRQRGGLAVGFAFTPHGVSEVQSVLVSHGVGVPNALGAEGGFPASFTANRLVQGSDLEGWFQRGRIPDDTAGLDGKQVALGAKPGRFPLRPGDVLICEMQGGGGYGDPFERDPLAVAEDVALGSVSLRAARELYGVAVVDGVVDRDETAALRAQRLRTVSTAADACRRSSDGRRRCICGQDLGQADGAWDLARAEHPALRYRAETLRPDLMVVVQSCPGCGRLYAVNIVPRGGQPEDTPGLIMTAPAEL